LLSRSASQRLISNPVHLPFPKKLAPYLALSFSLYDSKVSASVTSTLSFFFFFPNRQCSSLKLMHKLLVKCCIGRCGFLTCFWADLPCGIGLLGFLDLYPSIGFCIDILLGCKYDGFRFFQCFRALAWPIQTVSLPPIHTSTTRRL